MKILRVGVGSIDGREKEKMKKEQDKNYENQEQK